MFDSTWTAEGETRRAECVLRLPPDPNSAPVFMSYDMPKQFHVMQLVAEHSKVPVPEMLWLETDR